MDALDTAVALLGGVGRLARSLGVVQGAVSNWRKRGRVPVEHCAAIEQATQGAVRRWHLRPDDWRRVWPELVGTDGAPPVDDPDQVEVRDAA